MGGGAVWVVCVEELSEREVICVSDRICVGVPVGAGQIPVAAKNYAYFNKFIITLK